MKNRLIINGIVTFFGLLCSLTFSLSSQEMEDNSYVINNPQNSENTKHEKLNFVKRSERDFKIEKRQSILNKRGVSLVSFKNVGNQKENTDLADQKDEDGYSNLELQDSGSGANGENENISLENIQEDSGSGISESTGTDVYSIEPDSHSSVSDEASGSAELNHIEKSYFNNSSDVNVPHTHYDTEVMKRRNIPLSRHKSKRQFISRPRFVVRNGYVYMKAPPMTQKTIVTTHIPRPPMVVPYNTFLHRYRGASFLGPGHRNGHFILPSQQIMQEGDEGFEMEDSREEGKVLIKVFLFY